MKSRVRLMALAALLLAMLALPGLVQAQADEPEDRTVVGGTFTLAAGESLRNLNIFGGEVMLEAGSTVEDHVFLYGGSLTVNGAVEEDIHVYGGELILNATAVVGGNVSLTGAVLHRSSEARVSGQVTTTHLSPFRFRLPALPFVTPPDRWFSLAAIARNGFWFFMQTLGLTVLAMLVIVFAPKAMERAGDAAVARPWETGGTGLLVTIVTPPVLVGFALTFVGIPIAVMVVLLVGMALIFGWIALGVEVGKRLAQAFQADWPLVVDAGLGTFLLSLVANGIGQAPCVGWVVPTTIGFIGLGGVLLTRFGTRVYPGTALAKPS